VDGLATGVTTVVMVFFTASALLWKMTTLALVPAALVGGLLAFFLYNHHPAKVFMGDTGSLFLGGAVAALAFALDMPLILIPVGIIYIAEAMSDIIQVSYFKATHGKRIFKMAPLHHHLELSGWSENKLVTVFSLITAVCSLLAFLGIQGRY
jgi:phospho-N-acetylmuramoyl-pentapeptide-transferase